jgi:hypothetical protein
MGVAWPARIARVECKVVVQIGTARAQQSLTAIPGSQACHIHVHVHVCFRIRHDLRMCNDAEVLDDVLGALDTHEFVLCAVDGFCGCLGLCVARFLRLSKIQKSWAAPPFTSQRTQHALHSKEWHGLVSVRALA